MSDMLTFGVVGVGYFGRHYVRLLSQIGGVKLRAVSRISKRYEKEISGFIDRKIHTYEKPEELFRDPKIDCVIIATPTPFHFGLAKRALEEGKHVLLEKPMTRNVKEAELLRMAVLKSGRIFMVGHQYLYNDYIRYLKNELEKETLGSIRYIYGEHLYAGQGSHDMGCFWETATHELSIIDYLFSPHEIRSAQGIMIDLSGNGYDDFSSVGIDFERAPSAQIVVSWLYPEKIRRMTIIGEKGSAVFDEQNGEHLRLYIGGEVLAPSVRADEPLRNEILHFVNCIRFNKRPLTDIDHGVRITSYLEKILAEVKKESVVS